MPVEVGLPAELLELLGFLLRCLRPWFDADDDAAACIFIDIGRGDGAAVAAAAAANAAALGPFNASTKL